MTALVIALRREPWLRLVGTPADHAVPAIDRTPYRIRTSPLGHCASISLGAGSGDPGWTTALVVHDPDGAILDALPGAVITGAPAFHPSGGSLAFIREAAPGERAVVELDLVSGEQTVLLADGGARGCSWRSERELLVAFTDRIEVLDRVSGERTTMIRDTVAGGFARWGNDDLYVTLDDACTDEGDRIAWTRSWHQAGRASRGDVHVRDGAGETVIPGARAPRFLDGELAVLRRSGIYWPESGRRLDHVDIEDFDLVRS